MSEYILPQPKNLAGERFTLMLFLAISLHAIIILGISFSPILREQLQSKQPPLEITLVHERSEQAPEDADYLAQANLSGDGNTQEKTRPNSPAAMMVTTTSPGTSTNPLTPATPETAAPKMTESLTSQDSQQRIDTNKPVVDQQYKAKTAAELIQLSMEIAHLSAEIDQSMKAFSKQTKHRFITANAREFRDAAYLDAWRAKVERIGNLNYPDEAKRRNLSGSLVLDVAVNANGTLNDVLIRRSSGYKILDDAAIQIVKLAAPFAPFSEEMRKDTDVLHIIRGWQFLNENRLITSSD